MKGTRSEEEKRKIRRRGRFGEEENLERRKTWRAQRTRRCSFFENGLRKIHQISTGGNRSRREDYPGLREKRSLFSKKLNSLPGKVAARNLPRGRAMRIMKKEELYNTN